MNRIEEQKFKKLINQLEIPEDRKQLNQVNLRWILANAWIKNRQNSNLYELLNLIEPYA